MGKATLVNLASEFQKANPRLKLPELDVLNLDSRSVNVSLLQWSGRFTASRDRIGNDSHADVDEKFRKFADTLDANQPDLAVTPEYSTPWNAIHYIIENGKLPRNGAIWILGCESIMPSDLRAFCEAHRQIQWVYDKETLDRKGAFLDVACHFFRTETEAKRPQAAIVGLLQFKCHHMGGIWIERDHMIEGNRIYQISNRKTSIQLVTLICSDALQIDDAIIDEFASRPHLVVHIQLNARPRESQFRGYRTRLFSHKADDAEVICLNWSTDSSCHEDSEFRLNWGTAWYTKSNELDLADTAIQINHEQGIYVALSDTLHAGIYAFDGSEKIFNLSASKASQRLASGPAAKRTGPRVREVNEWDNEAKAWILSAAPSVFTDVTDECQNVHVALPPSLTTLDVVDFERFACISTGRANAAGWHEVQHNPFLRVTEGEVLERRACSLETDVGARILRIDTYTKMAALRQLLEPSRRDLPINVRDLSDGSLSYSKASWNTNFVTQDGSRRATFVHLGTCARGIAQETRFNMMKFLSDSEAKRLVIWHTQPDGMLNAYFDARFADITQTNDETSVSIVRDTDG